MNTFIEDNCVFEHAGRKFEAAGAVVTETHIIAYLGKPDFEGSKNGALVDWHGNEIGRYRITSTWRTQRSFFSSTMSAVQARLPDGRRYLGRSAGEGMIFRGKRAARQTV